MTREGEGTPAMEFGGAWVSEGFLREMIQN